MKKITFLMVCLQTVGFAMYGRPVLSLYSRYLTPSCDRYQRYFPYQDLYFRNYSYNRSIYSSYLYNLYSPYLNLYNLYSPYLNLYNLYSPYLNLYNLYSPYSSLYSRGLYWYYDPYRYSFSWDRYYPRCRPDSAIGKNNPEPKREQVLFLNKDTQTEEHSRIETKQPEPKREQVLFLNKYTQTEGRSSAFPKNEESSEKGRETRTHSRKLSCASASGFESIRKNHKKRSMSFGFTTDSKSNPLEEVETSLSSELHDCKVGENTTISSIQGEKTNTSRSYSFAIDPLQDNEISESNLKFNNPAENSQQDNKILCTLTERLMGENQEQRERCEDLQKQLEEATAQNQILADEMEMKGRLSAQQEENRKAEIARLNGKIQVLEAHNQKAEEDIEKTTKEKQLLQQEFLAKRQNEQKRREEQEAQIEALQKTKEELYKTIEELTNNIEKLNEEKDSITNGYFKEINPQCPITEPLLGIDSRFQDNDFQDKFRELEEENAELRKAENKTCELLNKIRELEEENAELRKVEKNTFELLKTKDKECRTLKDECKQLTKRFEDTQNIGEKLERPAQQYVDRLKELEKELENATQNQNIDVDISKRLAKQDSAMIENGIALFANAMKEVNDTRKDLFNNRNQQSEDSESVILDNVATPETTWAKITKVQNKFKHNSETLGEQNSQLELKTTKDAKDYKALEETKQQIEDQHKKLQEAQTKNLETIEELKKENKSLTEKNINQHTPEHEEITRLTEENEFLKTQNKEHEEKSIATRNN